MLDAAPGPVSSALPFLFSMSVGTTLALRYQLCRELMVVNSDVQHSVDVGDMFTSSARVNGSVRNDSELGMAGDPVTIAKAIVDPSLPQLEKFQQIMLALRDVLQVMAVSFSQNHGSISQKDKTCISTTYFSLTSECNSRPELMKVPFIMKMAIVDGLCRLPLWFGREM